MWFLLFLGHNAALYDYERDAVNGHRDPRYDLVKKPFKMSTRTFHSDLASIDASRRWRSSIYF